MACSHWQMCTFTTELWDAHFPNVNSVNVNVRRTLITVEEPVFLSCDNVHLTSASSDKFIWHCSRAVLTACCPHGLVLP